MGPDGFAGYRVGMPFFIPVDAYDYRFQVLDNVSLVSGNHLFKFGRGVEPDRGEPDLPRLRQRADAASPR